jgi:hypothetical protein
VRSRANVARKWLIGVGEGFHAARVAVEPAGPARPFLYLATCSRLSI